MEITVTPRGILQIDNARLVHKNFSGLGGKYNREGDKNFGLVIPDEDIAKMLSDAGWNIKIKPPREEGDSPFMFLPVKVKFNDRGPNVYLVSGRSRNKLDEESICCLDNIDIASVDLDVRPYDWNVNGKQGRTAYLHAMSVVQNVDRFADRFREDDFADEPTF